MDSQKLGSLMDILRQADGKINPDTTYVLDVGNGKKFSYTGKELLETAKHALALFDKNEEEQLH